MNTTACDRLCRLDELEPGLGALIVSLDREGTCRKRLISLGFVPGMRVSVLRHFGSQPMVVAREGCEIALSPLFAREITVRAEREVLCG